MNIFVIRQNRTKKKKRPYFQRQCRHWFRLSLSIVHVFWWRHS